MAHLAPKKRRRDLEEELAQDHGKYIRAESSQEKVQICTKCDRADIEEVGLSYSHFLCQECRSEGFLSEFDREYRR